MLVYELHGHQQTNAHFMYGNFEQNYIKCIK